MCMNSEPAQKLVGGFQQDPFVHTMKTMFAEESEYGIAFKNRQSAYDPNRLQLKESMRFLNDFSCNANKCVCVSVCLSVCVSVCLSVYLSVYLSVCVSICLSICL